MRAILFGVALTLLLQLLNYSCANQTSIQGGPRDTIPPILIETYPPNETLNFSETSIRLLFSEDVKTDKLKSELLIIPKTELEYKVLTKKQEVILEFEGSFQDSTTYIFNFGEGVGDLNENNPVVNLKYAFSTGQYIDSLKVSGSVYDINTKEPQKEFLVSLYDHDTTNVFDHQPKYYVFTDKDGNFEITNVKQGTYRIYAINDQNKNLQLDSDTEDHGFVSDTLQLDSSIFNLEIPTLLQDAGELFINRTRPVGNHFDISFSKYVSNYTYTTLDSNRVQALHNNLVEDNTILRFYQKNPIEKDSLGIDLIAYDSLGNQIRDTLYIQFNSSDTRAQEYELNLSPSARIEVFDTTKFRVHSNKPISIVNNTKASIKVDTLIFPLRADTILNYQTNPNSTVLTFQVASIFSHVNNWLDSLVVLTTQDTSQVVIDSVLLNQNQFLSQLKKNSYTLEFAPGWIMSNEGDSSEIKFANFTKMDPESLGVVRGNIETEQTHFILELVDNNGNSIKSLTNPPAQYQFDRLEPGSYSLRVLIDENQDGKWSYGNIRNHITPEPIWYYDQTFEVRANWELENIDIAF